MPILKCPMCGSTNPNSLEYSGDGIYFCKSCFSAFCPDETPSNADDFTSVNTTTNVAGEPVQSAGKSAYSTLLENTMNDLLATYGSKKAKQKQSKAPRSLESMSAEELREEGYAYELGTGRDKNLVEAFKCFKIAAEKGDAESMYKVAYAYENAQGTEADDAKAYFWYKEGFRSGNERCGRIIRERFAEYESGAAAPNQPKSGKQDPNVAKGSPANKTTPVAPKTTPVAGNGGYTNIFSKMFVELLPSVVRIDADTSTGTGFLLKNGYIATNAHVVLDEDEETGKATYLPSYGFTFSPKISNKIYRAKLVGYDQQQDVALLKYDDPDEFADRALTLGDSDAIIPGEDAFTIGNGKDYGLSFTKLSISQSPMPGANFGFRQYDEVIQMTGSTQCGNSGGPVFNMAGEVIGLVTFHTVEKNTVYGVLPTSDGKVQLSEQVVRTATDGVRFAVTSNTLKRLARKLKANV